MLLIPVLAPFNTLAEGHAAFFEKDLDIVWGVWQSNLAMFQRRLNEMDTKVSGPRWEKNIIRGQGAGLLKRDLRTTEKRRRADI